MCQTGRVGREPLRWRLRADEDEDEGSEVPFSFQALWQPRAVGGVLFCVSSYCPIRSIETPSFCFSDNEVSSCFETRLMEKTLVFPETWSCLTLRVSSVRVGREALYKDEI